MSVLRKVNLIAAEDTRHTSLLLNHFSINTPLFVFHAYNEKKRVPVLLSKLRLGHAVALVSDAGTPLINDPGYCLVRSCCLLGVRVVPLPGACAAITALSASGLPTNRFCFEGFLPSRQRVRINYLRKIFNETRTLIFYVSKYDMLNVLRDMVVVFGSERYVVLVRELTKMWESIYRGVLKEVLDRVEHGQISIRGEIVLVVAGYCINKQKKREEMLSMEVRYIIDLLAKELPYRRVIDLVVKICGVNKNMVYKYLLKEEI